jgi:hypothetical protein
MQLSIIRVLLLLFVVFFLASAVSSSTETTATSTVDAHQDNDNDNDDDLLRFLQQQQQVEVEEDDPCFALLEDALVGGLSSSASSAAAPSVIFLKPSYYEACIASFLFQDNGTSMLEHIQELQAVLSQYHSFYYLAQDPGASEPLIYGQEHGYSVYGDGDHQANNQGRVNLQEGLQDIYTAIIEENNPQQAGQADFWKIASLLNQLQDAHVNVEPWSLYPQVELMFLPQRVLDNSNNNNIGNVQVVPTFSYDTDGQLQLSLRYITDSNSNEEDEDDDDETLVVQSFHTTTNNNNIETQSVHDFVLQLANSSALTFGYPSVGARVNMMITTRALFDVPFGSLVCSGRPSHVLPEDQFTVVYQDGTSETMHVAVAILATQSIFESLTVDSSDGSGQTYVYVNRTLIDSILNQPGPLRQNYNVALGRITNAPFVPNNNNQQRQLKQQQQQVPRDTVFQLLRQQEKGKEQTNNKNSSGFSRRNLQQQRQDFVFDNLINSDIDPATTVAAYKIIQENDDGYAILKLPSFLLSVDKMADVYKTVALAAKEQGVTKLMIDVSGNGGGVASAGITLAYLLYPSLDAKWFQNRWNIRYNEVMDAFSVYSAPVLADMFFLLSNETLSSYFFQTSFGNVTDDMIETVSITVDSMDLLCPSNGIACQILLPFLQNSTAAFAASRDYVDFANVLLSLVSVLTFINPWTVGLPETWLDDPLGVLFFAMNTSMVNINYGGVVSSYTSRFDIGYDGSADSLAYISALVASTTAEIDFAFDEYIIVSDGVAGSTTAIFVSSAEQIWKNRDRSDVSTPLTTVAYGGTGKLEDIALTAFPASIRDVNLDYPLVANAALYVWEILVQGLDEYADIVQTARTSYQSALVPPPYYAASVPTLPVVTYFDTFMGPESLPLQYIYMPPDKYIQSIYPGVSIDYSLDLANLYTETASFFENGGYASSASAVSARRIEPWFVLALMTFLSALL